MNFIKRYWPILGLGFTLLIVTYYIVHGHKNIIKSSKTIAMIPPYALQLKDVHYVHDDPKKGAKWELDAKKVRFSKDRSTIFFFDFCLTVTSKGEKTFDLKGQKGRYERQKSLIFLSGNIKATDGKNCRLYTDRLVFNEKTSRAYSDDPVKIEGPFFNIRGKGFVLDLKRKKIEVLSDVKSIIQKTSH